MSASTKILPTIESCKYRVFCDTTTAKMWTNPIPTLREAMDIRESHLKNFARWPKSFKAVVQVRDSSGSGSDQVQGHDEWRDMTEDELKDELLDLAKDA